MLILLCHVEDICWFWSRAAPIGLDGLWLSAVLTSFFIDQHVIPLKDQLLIYQPQSSSTLLTNR